MREKECWIEKHNERIRDYLENSLNLLKKNWKQMLIIKKDLGLLLRKNEDILHERNLYP
jgi:hypothetical protein